MADQEKKTALTEQKIAHMKLKKAIEAHLSVTISGSNTFPLGEGRIYSLTATLHYYETDLSSTPSGAPFLPTEELPAFTFKQDWSPISKLSSLTGLYRLHPISPPNAEAIHYDRILFELDDEPKPVNTKNGFICLHPNESVTRELTLVPVCFDAKPETRYKIQMALGYGRIEWWGVGEMEEFENVEVRCTERSEDGGLITRPSNEIEVFTREEIQSGS